MVSQVWTPFVLLATLAVQVALANNSARWYQPQDSFVGDEFLNGFDFFTDQDPTNGRVK